MEKMKEEREENRRSRDEGEGGGELARGTFFENGCR